MLNIWQVHNFSFIIVNIIVFSAACYIVCCTYTMSMMSICLFVKLLDCDHTVQQNLGIGRHVTG